MASTLLYIGPGLGLGTIVIVIIILALVVFSLGYILWIPIKNFFRRISGDKQEKVSEAQSSESSGRNRS